MKEYRVTVWHNWKYGKKYTYRVALSNPLDYKKSLSKNHNRFTIEEV